MNNTYIRDTTGMSTTHGKPEITMHQGNLCLTSKEIYDDGYNACMMEIQQLVGPAGGSMDAVVQHVESYVQQRNRESVFKSSDVA